MSRCYPPYGTGNFGTPTGLIPHPRIILIGEAGAGKSTLANQNKPNNGSQRDLLSDVTNSCKSRESERDESIWRFSLNKKSKFILFLASKLLNSQFINYRVWENFSA